jgi:hypothetical protein
MRAAARSSFEQRFKIHRAVDSLLEVLERHGVGQPPGGALKRVA